jgi:Transposase DDE domain group 1
MAEKAPLLPGLSPVGGKPGHVTFDGGRLTSEAGVPVLAQIERRRGLAERLARCIEGPRAPERVRHGVAEMIRFRALLIAAGDPDGNDGDVLRADPAFELARGRPPETGLDPCSQPTMRRLENLPGPTAPQRMMAAMVELERWPRSSRRRLRAGATADRARPRAGVRTNAVRGPGTIPRTACTATSSWRCSTLTMTGTASCR